MTRRGAYVLYATTMISNKKGNTVGCCGKRIHGQEPNES